VNKIIFILVFIILSNCSLNENSKFWSASKEINQEPVSEKQTISREIIDQDKIYNEEFNPGLKIIIPETFFSSNDKSYTNNDGKTNFNGNLKYLSKYKFSKIKNFYQYEPEIVFDENNIIFFNNKGTIIKFDDNSKVKWKKNYYSKSEKKLNPVLQFAKKNNYLIVTDNLARYYMLDTITGNLIWSKNNIAPFNSQIKIFKDKFYTIDFSNTLRCFSIENGKELWNVKTQQSLIRSQKKLSIVFVENVIFFNNSNGDISAVNLLNGELLWQLPTQNSLIYESSFSLETSDLVTDNKSLFFSNNKNQFFSIDINTGSFNWDTKINSNVRPTIIGNILFTISMEGYLFLIDKEKGNIIRVTDIFSNFKIKKRNYIKPTGFILGKENIYLSTNNGKLLVIDIKTGKTISTLKIDNEKILRPFVFNDQLFIVKDNSIIKLN
tara:strand:+ start:37 stop:1347 length:1311 start_codon:yes stop_codon:yes gene_type:complete